MPRRNRREPTPVAPAARPGGRSAAPAWADLPGHEVREVAGDKAYRCPGCDHEIRVGLRHLVVVPMHAPDERRHWHIECWRSELRRIGAYRPTSLE
jgi:hypothetical protein